MSMMLSIVSETFLLDSPAASEWYCAIKSEYAELDLVAFFLTCGMMSLRTFIRSVTEENDSFK